MAKKTRLSRKELEEKISSDLTSSFTPSLSQQFENPPPRVELPYKFQFRSSRLPFCPREYVIHHRFKKEDIPVVSESYGFSFYVGIGSAVHEVVQKFLGMSNFLYGSWTCCGVSEHEREGSTLCGVCGHPQLYEELAPRSELGMHVDGVSALYNGVTEFKTTSSKNIGKLTNPYPQHMMQASCYLHALNEEHGWHLDKLIFVYFSRDNPTEFKVFVRSPLSTAYTDTLQLYKSAQHDLLVGTIPARTCETISDAQWKGCPYTGVCFLPSLEDLLVPVERLTNHGK